jgi:hypothetical protein
MPDMKTVYEARAAEVWRLVHGEGLPMKSVASTLRVSLGEAYGLLAYWKSRRDVAEIRRAARATFKAMSLQVDK